MKKIFVALFCMAALVADELKIEANLFTADQKSGLSIFEGDVHIQKGSDELNASKVTVYVNEQKEPTKFHAQGDVSFFIHTQEGAQFKGQAYEAIYFPETKEYHFFKNVHLQQLDDKKEIVGEEVVLKSIEGNAYAKGAEKEPVIMIFDLKEKDTQKEQ